MKSPKKALWSLILSTAAATASLWAGEPSPGQACCPCIGVSYRHSTAYLVAHRFDRHYYCPPLTFRGGWYALNYPYYWGYGPTVGYYDPYDANGNYFPYPLPRR